MVTWVKYCMKICLMDFELLLVMGRQTDIAEVGTFVSVCLEEQNHCLLVCPLKYIYLFLNLTSAVLSDDGCDYSFCHNRFNI
jgi:hypothetical protein